MLEAVTGCAKQLQPRQSVVAPVTHRQVVVNMQGSPSVTARILTPPAGSGHQQSEGPSRDAVSFSRAGGFVAIARRVTTRRRPVQGTRRRPGLTTLRAQVGLPLSIDRTAYRPANL
ncbi:MAG: hypothetical protein AMXMBFR33_46960 [Candidatus Xenobia bacterium]